MRMHMLRWLFILISTTLSIAKEPELPLCPTNIQFFPQQLPMHCRMPSNAVFPTLSQGPEDPQTRTLPPMLPPFYQSPPPDKMPEPIPIPVPPGFPGPMGFPGPVPMPMPMPMPAPGPAHKLPVIVMPFYSPDPSYKKTQNFGKPKHKRKKDGIYKKRIIDSDETSSDTDTDTSDESSDTSSDRGFWKKKIGRNGRKSSKHSKRDKRKHNKKKDMLTPLLQYVTKDGYVIYEKKISKGEATDWLNPKTEDQNNGNDNVGEGEQSRNEHDDDVLLEEVKPNARDNVEHHTTATEKGHKKHKQRQHKMNPSKNSPLKPM